METPSRGKAHRLKEARQGMSEQQITHLAASKPYHKIYSYIYILLYNII